MFSRTKKAYCAAGVSILLAVSLAFPFAGVMSAYADDLSDAQAALEEASAQLDAITAEYEELQKEIEELDEQISATTKKVQEAQAAMLEGQELLGEAVLAEYKSDGGFSLVNIILSSSDISDLVTNMTYYVAIQEDQAEMIAEQRELNEQFNEILDELNEQRDAQQEKLDEAEEKKTEAEAVVSEASAKVTSETELAALRAQAEQMDQADDDEEQEISSNWNTNTERVAASDSSSSSSSDSTNTSNGWKSGLASAYGGSSDPGVSNPAYTANGSICNDSSMGVAIPMSWSNYRSYFGRAIEISYGGKTVVATINDCGSLGGGARALDLQPGVFKALGFSTCQAWGVRTVSYRIL